MNKLLHLFCSTKLQFSLFNQQYTLYFGLNLDINIHLRILCGREVLYFVLKMILKTSEWFAAIFKLWENHKNQTSQLITPFIDNSIN